MSRLKQPLKWHGGKTYLAQRIVALMPPHLHYVETHFGGGAVLLAHDPAKNWLFGHEDYAGKTHQNGCSEVVNDIHSELTNFWQVLQDVELFERFKRIIDAVPFSVTEWRTAREDDGDRDDVDRAVNFFIDHRQSMAGRGDCFTPLSKTRTRGARNEQANAWWGCIEGLPAVRDRLQGVVILNECAAKVIRQQDGKHTLFYCDPPYLKETRVTSGEYDFEMTEAQHIELLDVLSRITGKFLLSGYPSELYTDWERRHGWTRHEFKIDNKASSAKQKATMTECVWCNF
ncbi:MAG: DNA adenine methylase [Planctomycetota bacterium]|nr:DNA adenine methylase [Planctomycetota bacterium]